MIFVKISTRELVKHRDHFNKYRLSMIQNLANRHLTCRKKLLQKSEQLDVGNHMHHYHLDVKYKKERFRKKQRSDDTWFGS